MRTRSSFEQPKFQKQNYGTEPIKLRKTDHYKEEYIQSFVGQWDELIGWDLRAQSEGNFFIDILKNHGVQRVLDVSTGTGFHSIRLLQAGFDVVSADGSGEMLAKAFENGRSYGLVLRTVQADWRWLSRDIHEKFDAVICLGNSFTHLFQENERRKALAEFYSVLKHDGVLILDQRNYDTMLAQGFQSKHIYYYCGENVKAEPEHVDEGLARFRYEFPDNSVFHLNMFPLRKAYTRRLMSEVGFQRIKTYGDFQETYHQDEPDFFIHLASKVYESEVLEEQNCMAYSSAVNTAREYYNSDSADKFYATIWGGEDIHIGLYNQPQGDDIREASHRTVEKIASLVNLNENSQVLDIGSGYGGAARHLAKTFGCRVICLNLSEVQNERNRKLNKIQGLDSQIKVVDGNFEDIPEEDESFDLVWSQDAILHSGNRLRVFREVQRVLKRKGEFIFTDPMQSDNCPDGVLKPVLDRIHLDSLGSVVFYRKALAAIGFKEIQFIDLSEQLVNHYSHVLQVIEKECELVISACGQNYIDRMKVGLRHWIEKGQQSYLTWGILHFCKN